MQYKIPVQIENEDPIILWLSLRQLVILMIGWAIAYQAFVGLSQSVGEELWLLVAIFIFGFTLLVALFKHSWMTFIPFVLAFLRYNGTGTERRWEKWVDSFQPIDIWFVVLENQKQEKQIDFKSKLDKINHLEDKLNKL